MRKIFKYFLQAKAVQMVEMPKGAVVLTAQAQRETICVWARVDPDAPPIKRCFIVYGTGERADDIAEEYVGTAQLQNGDFVFHVFTDNVEYPRDS